MEGGVWRQWTDLSAISSVAMDTNDVIAIGRNGQLPDYGHANVFVPSEAHLNSWIVLQKK